MKKKILITLASLASLTTGITAPLLLSSCSNAKLKITMEGSKWGYIISDVKPYYEYTLTLSNGFKKGDLVEMEIVNPSVDEKIKLDNDSKTIEGDDINSMIVKVVPCNPSTEQEQFSVNFSLRLVVKRESKKIYSTQIDSLILDAVIPAINPDFYTYADEEKTILTGINVDRATDLLKTGCLVIPSTVKTIKQKAFSYAKDVTPKILEKIYQSNKWLLLDYSIYDPGVKCSLETIEPYAFFQNEFFQEALYIPKTVKTIGASAFARCYNFTQIKFANESQLESIGANAFQEVWHVVEPFEIPKNSTLTELPKSLFVGVSDNKILCKGIKIPNNIQKTDSPVFNNFSNLEWIDLSDFDELPTSWSDLTFGRTMPKSGIVYVKNEAMKTGWQKLLENDLPGWSYEIKN